MRSVFKRGVKAKVSADPSDVQRPTLLPVGELPKARRPYGSKGTVVGAHGLVYAPSGVYGHSRGSSPPPSPAHEETEGYGQDVEMKEAEGPDDVELDDQASKKQRQWRKWSEDIIPSLIKPYLEVLRATSGLRDIDKIRRQDGCKGCVKGELLDVSCIFFERELSLLFHRHNG